MTVTKMKIIAPSLQFKAGKQAGWNSAALQFASTLLVLSTCWCTAGLVALDMSQIFPTSLSPLLAAIKIPVHLTTTLALLCAAPITHCVGKLLVPRYQLYEPLRGGKKFIQLQAGGWCCYAAGLMYVAADVVQFVFPSAPSVCLHCAPGFLIALAIMMCVGNSLLIASLYNHEIDIPQEQMQRIKTSQLKEKVSNDLSRSTSATDWSTVVDVLLIAAAVIGCVFLGLKHHPNISFGKEKDAFFASDDGSVELPFCEKPYLFSESMPYPLNQVAQLPSAVLHMPYIPILNLLLYYGCPNYKGIRRGPEQVQVLVGLLVFQFWTGVGHIHPNPRKLFIQETSIMMSLIVLRAFVNAMTTNERYKIGTLPFLKLLVFMLSSYVCVGLMPTIVLTTMLQVGCLCLSINGQDICRPDAAADSRVARKNIYRLVSQILPDLTKRGRIVLVVLLISSIGLLCAEVVLCRTLMAYDATISWHAPFDLFFWQGFWVLIQVVALSKPGSMWRRDPNQEKELAFLAAASETEEFKFKFPLLKKHE